MRRSANSSLRRCRIDIVSSESLNLAPQSQQTRYVWLSIVNTRLSFLWWQPKAKSSAFARGSVTVFHRGTSSSGEFIKRDTPRTPFTLSFDSMGGNVSARTCVRDEDHIERLEILNCDIARRNLHDFSTLSFQR
jgi:hypothetical protein